MSLDADVDLDLQGRISLSLGRMEAKIDKVDKFVQDQYRLSQFPRQIPFFQQFSAAGFFDAGGPQMGRFWQVRLFGVTGVATPGLGSWVVGGTPPVITLYEGQNVTSTQLAAGILTPTQVRWQLNALPGWENFSGDQCRINQNQHLIIGVANVPATTLLTVVVVVNDIRMDAGEAVAVGA